LALRGADVTLLSGPVTLDVPQGVRLLQFESVSELMQLMEHFLPEADAVVMAAAVGDFTTERREGKLRRQGELTLTLKATPDVVGSFAAKYTKPVYVALQLEAPMLSKMLRKSWNVNTWMPYLQTVLTLPRRDLL